MMNLYIKLSVCVPRLIPGRGFYAQISSEITSEFPGVTGRARKRERKGEMGRNRPKDQEGGTFELFK